VAVEGLTDHEPREMSVTDAGIRVAIVEDDAPTRDALDALIGRTPGFRSVATFGSVEEALAGLSAASPDLLLLDIHLPGMSGSQGVRLLRGRYPGLQVVMLTVFAEEERIFESLCNGACGYLLKRTPPARLLEALREAHEGGSPMSPDIARKVVAAFQHPPPAEREGEAEQALTPHEVRIVRMLANGDSYREVADQLDITINTVRNYIRSIYEKLQVHTKSEAVSKALRGRLIT
jgi:DNA-binding NarL/FixJ family response regulator